MKDPTMYIAEACLGNIYGLSLVTVQVKFDISKIKSDLR